MAGGGVEQQQPGHIGGAHEALLGEHEVAREEREVAELLPLRLRRVGDGDVVGHLVRVRGRVRVRVRVVAMVMSYATW